MQKLLTFFQQKMLAYLHITQLKFNESLTNDIVSFEQLGPGNQMPAHVPLFFADVRSLFLGNRFAVINRLGQSMVKHAWVGLCAIISYS